MNTKYLVSVKSSGLSYNIIRLLLLTDLAKKHNRQLVFITKADHISFLKKFNPNCIYIPYVPDHTHWYNSFTRKKHMHILYDVKYKKFLKSTYVDHITTDIIHSNDITYINGGIRDLNNTSHNLIFFDFCEDIKYTTDQLNNIPCPDFITAVNFCNYKEDIISINVKLDEPDNSRIYDFWDEIIPIIKQKYNTPLLLISGNNDIKRYIGEKHDCIYEIKGTETKYSFKRGSNTIRGKPDQVFDDLLICANTHFISHMQIKKEYGDILNRYNDITFLSNNYIEKFDVLAQYFSASSQLKQKI
jgi:hypothetical protein